MLITLYGINNIGKTTHAKRLVKRLCDLGKKAVYVKYPIYDQEPTGPYLNSILRSGQAQKMTEEELQLWFVLNRYQFQPQLKKMLKEGTIVIAEDYIGTGIAWGAAKGGNLKELISMNKFLVKEDCAIFMFGTRDTRAEEKNHIHETNTKLIQECQKWLKKLAKRYSWIPVEVADNPEVTAENLWGEIKKCLKIK